MMNDIEVERAITRAQAAYHHGSSLGQVLESVDSFRPAAIEFEAAAHVGHPDSLTELTTSLFRDRRNGSRFLTESDWDSLERVHASWPNFAPVATCRELRRPWTAGTPRKHGNIVLLDARTLQLPHMNGTKHHARSLARAFADALPAGFDLALFTSHRLPALSSDIASLSTIEWKSALIGDVDVYVQLATMMDPNDPTNVDFLRVPWIRRVSVFLDDIQGLHPAHFIGSHAHFWEHQVTIEKLRSSDVVLTLGQTSNEEARSLWNSLDSTTARPRFIVSSCLSGLPASRSDKPNSGAGDMIVFGNHLPHKNIGLAAAASALIHLTTRGQPSMVFVAAVSRVQQDEIRRLAEGAGIADSSSFLSFASKLDGEELSHLIAQSRGVIVPSLHEGFSLPVIEAIERGVPVALSRIPAHQELLPEGPWFFDPRSVESLVSVVRDMGDNGVAWADAQSRALAERYSRSTLPGAVRESLEIAVNPGDASNPFRASNPDGASIPGGSSANRSRETARHVSVDDLRSRDTTLMRTLLARPQSFDVVDAGARTLTSVRHEHDALVAEFHQSRTWRAGRLVTAPLRWLRALRGRRT